MSSLNFCVDIAVNSNSSVRVHLEAPSSIPPLLKVLDLAAYSISRLHCVFHLTVHIGSILIFLNVAYAMHYDVFTWMPIQNNKGAFT